MDNITLIGLIGSIVSIVSLLISLFDSSKKYSILSNNRNSFNQTLNINSNNTVTNNYDFRTNVNSSTQKTSSISQDPGIVIFIGIVVSLIVIPLYVIHQNIVIFYVIVFGIIGLVINLFVLIALNKRVFLSKLYLCSNTLKWFPLFILLIFIYHPLYLSGTLNETKQLLTLRTGLFTLLQSHGSDVVFLGMQIAGIVLISLLMAINIFKSLKQLYNTYKKDKYPTTGNWKDILWYTILVLIVFILVSGLYVRFFNYLEIL